MYCLFLWIEVEVVEGLWGGGLVVVVEGWVREEVEGRWGVVAVEEEEGWEVVVEVEGLGVGGGGIVGCGGGVEMEGEVGMVIYALVEGIG